MPTILMLILLAWWLPTDAATLTLAWGPSPGATGYRLHYGTGSGMYQEVLDAQTATQVAVGGLHEGYTYFFAATAYNPYGESGYSNEVLAVITSAPVVTLTHPPPGSVPRRGTVRLQAEVTSSVSIVLVTFLVNSSEQCALQSSPYQCDWLVPAANKRVYQLQARALDAEGRVGVSPFVEVIAQ